MHSFGKLGGRRRPPRDIEHYGSLLLQDVVHANGELSGRTISTTSTPNSNRTRSTVSSSQGYESTNMGPQRLVSDNDGYIKSKFPIPSEHPVHDYATLLASQKVTSGSSMFRAISSTSYPQDLFADPFNVLSPTPIFHDSILDISHFVEERALPDILESKVSQVGAHTKKRTDRKFDALPPPFSTRRKYTTGGGISGAKPPLHMVNKQEGVTRISTMQRCVDCENPLFRWLEIKMLGS